MEKKKGNIVSNFLYQVVYQVLIMALPLVLSPYTSRVLGADGLGIYSYTYSIAYYFVLVAMLGIANYGNRCIARVRDDRNKMNSEFSSVVTLHILLSVICIIAYIGYLFFVPELKFYFWLQLPYVISGLFDITWFYYGIEKFKITVTRNVLIKGGSTLAVFLFVKKEEDLWLYCFIMAISTMLSQVIMWVPLKKYVSFVKPSKQEIFKHLKPMSVLFIPAIAISMYKYMDKIMIGLLSTKKELGYYENSESIIKAVNLVLASLGTVMLPQMSNLIANKEMEKFNRYIAMSMRYLMIFSYGIACGLCAVAVRFSVLFWGKDFLTSGSIIMVLVISVPFTSFANVLRNQYLLPNNKDKEYASSVIIGAILNLIVNAILIPSMASVGASVATVFAEGAVCLVQVYWLRKLLPVKKYFLDTLPCLISAVVMFGVVSVIGMITKATLVGMLLQILVGVLVYGVCVLIILLIKKDEFIKKLFSVKKG